MFRSDFLWDLNSECIRDLWVRARFGGGDVTAAANAATAMDDIDAALDVVTTDRATYGAAMSRFSYAISNLQITGENQAAARGRIMDADFAAETAP